MRHIALTTEMIKCKPVILTTWECPACEQVHVGYPQANRGGWVTCPSCRARFDQRNFEEKIPLRMRRLIDEIGAKVI